MALGDTSGAAAAHAALYRLKPDFDLGVFRKVFPYRNDETVDRFWITMVRAGLDEPPRENS
jgi:hypothetical protein